MMSFAFDGQKYDYPSRRRVVYAKRGMVCTSQPLAAQAGLTILQQGGNAVDAAVATAICMTVLEPTSNGLGSDAFALVWIKDKLYGLNGSGYAPKNLTAEALAKQGVTDKIPYRGWQSVNIPGAVSAWAELHKRFGRLPFAKLCEPAIYYAEEGYPLSPLIQQLWSESVELFKEFKDKKEFGGWFPTFAPQGKAPEVGELVKLPYHGKTLRQIAESCGEAFYRGTVADKIVEFSQATGGFISKEDLANYRAEWVEPLHTEYRGYDVWEIPPNGQGMTVLMALNILKGFDFAEKECSDTYHKQIEAMKLAFADTMEYVTDPRYMQTKVEDMLSDEYASARRSLIGDKALEPKPGSPFSGGTIYLCTADNEGNMVSLIQSNYKGFGSGIVVPETGIALNDRASGFSLNPASDNYLQPWKKPYHTIIPGFLTKNGRAVGPFGVMGEYMQPQGQLQVVMDTVDFLMNPQNALDAPRWQWIEGKRIQVEDGVPDDIVEELRRRGHEITVMSDYTSFGRGQIIWRDENGVLAGATEPRTDGTVAAW